VKVAGVMSHDAKDGYVGLFSSILKFFRVFSCLLSSFELKIELPVRNCIAQFSASEII
jgi:hypothetical protein